MPRLRVLGDGFVVSVDRDTTVLERGRQDLAADPGLASAGPAAVLPCAVDHAVAAAWLRLVMLTA